MDDWTHWIRSLSICSTLLAREITLRIFACSSSEMLDVTWFPEPLAPMSEHEGDGVTDRLAEEAYGLTDGDEVTAVDRVFPVVLRTDQPASSLLYKKRGENDSMLLPFPGRSSDVQT